MARRRSFWNGADSMIPMRRAEKRPFSLLRRATMRVRGLNVIILRTAAKGVN